MDIEVSLAAEPLTHIGSFPITNTFALALLMSVGLMISGYIVGKKAKLVPGSVQNVFEAVVEYFFEMTDSLTGDRKKTAQFFPLIATIFIFILVGNWTEVIPGLGTIGIHALHESKETFIPFLRSTGADFTFTLSLAIVTVLASQYFGIKHLGFFHYMKKFINFSNPINFFVGILELISEVAKLISLSFRLFGNIFAGEVLLTVITALTYVIVPLPFYFLEIFVGLVQALVFASLALVFLSTATYEAH